MKLLMNVPKSSSCKSFDLKPKASDQSVVLDTGIVSDRVVVGIVTGISGN